MIAVECDHRLVKYKLHKTPMADQSAQKFSIAKLSSLTKLGISTKVLR